MLFQVAYELGLQGADKMYNYVGKRAERCSWMMDASAQQKRSRRALALQ